MSTIIETTVYAFDELSDQAKERARDWYREGCSEDTYWHENVTDEAKTLLGLIGFDVSDIRFSGFWSQGDGASFVGLYRYKKGGLKALKAELPHDHELLRIAAQLHALQRQHFYQLYASITPDHSCHYAHELSTHIDVSNEQGPDVNDETTEALRELIIDINRWIYQWLRDEWEYVNSDETVDDNIRGNAYTFTEHGKRFG